eukprot:TRINITY_DN6124_c0_g1_i3.p1 TRINITY_DN6124_c0_g1~~TRINITY_DN6124_c0_g1_i3.p1  ORF type:complete len:600 (+),score=71.53 TRINITY_DN6124_c0_g1_i3:112-1911(+)
MTLSQIQGAFQSLFDAFIAAPPSLLPSGLRNLGNTCYFNAVVQLLAASNCFYDYLDELEKHVAGVDAQLQLRALLNDNAAIHQRVGLHRRLRTISAFRHLLTQLEQRLSSAPNVADARPCLQAMRIRIGLQQDAHELLVNLFDQLTLTTTLARVGRGSEASQPNNNALNAGVPIVMSRFAILGGLSTAETGSCGARAHATLRQPSAAVPASDGAVQDAEPSTVQGETGVCTGADRADRSGDIAQSPATSQNTTTPPLTDYLSTSRPLEADGTGDHTSADGIESWPIGADRMDTSTATSCEGTTAFVASGHDHPELSCPQHDCGTMQPEEPPNSHGAMEYSTCNSADRSSQTSVNLSAKVAGLSSPALLRNPIPGCDAGRCQAGHTDQVKASHPPVGFSGSPKGRLLPPWQLRLGQQVTCSWCGQLQPMTVNNACMLTIYMKANASTQGLVDDLFHPEPIDYTCDACRLKGECFGSPSIQAHKRLMLIDLPELLVLHVQRVMHGMVGSYKGTMALAVDNDVMLCQNWPLPMHGFVSYRLQAVVCHKGRSAQQGHYETYRRSMTKYDSLDSWCCCDDEKVYACRKPDFRNAYLLLYQRFDA